MSRSPDSSRVTREGFAAYESSWEAIYNLIDEGKSWSGRERNCALLNARAARFADVSAATGLDFDDDGRAVAMSDWDFDGRLDIWVSNRTAPRLRLLHNVGAGECNFVAIRLQGVTCNRDAIGARLTIELAGGAKLIRTLHAGDGYLAQSSKWLHFGLGDAKTVEGLEIRWPGGKRESFVGIEAGGFYRVVQGSGTTERWQPPREQRIALEEKPLIMPERPGSSRAWIVGRVPFPAESYRSWEGEAEALNDLAGRPLLLNLWSLTCAPCLAELAEWQQHWQAISDAGGGILALCVDPDPQLGALASAPFQTGIATEEMSYAFETIHHALFESRKPLPVPCSILLDANGLAAAIYKGPVSSQQIVADLELLDAPPEMQRAAAVPFPGRWRMQPLRALPRQVIGTLMKAGRKRAAEAYTLRCLDRDSKLALDAGTRASLTLFLGDLHLDEGELDRASEIYGRLFELAPDDAGIHREVAKRLITKQRVDDALLHLNKAVALDPSHLDSRLNLATLQMRLGWVVAATENLRELVKLQPESAPLRFQLANALHGQRLTEEALMHFREAHRLQPNSPATNNLAWILATHPDETIRNGTEALALAKEAVRVTEHKDPVLLSTLAAAYAEAGDFESAVATAEKSLSIATEKSETTAAFIQQLNSHLELYRAGRPVRG